MIAWYAPDAALLPKYPIWASIVISNSAAGQSFLSMLTMLVPHRYRYLGSMLFHSAPVKSPVRPGSEIERSNLHRSAKQ